ncbi:alpha-1,4-glucan--maltose-1-phosphate maltosyltransferase [uncultured Friedmanniella sp.]|uniref:alpha-1,4-glucan--maltose-1-phosphate maltosyltransferase n=1 Tax=uncultured Friedmanniella sp. TaxID=335381 RepID=UPI0035CAB855
MTVTTSSAAGTPFGRIPVTKVSPVIEGGAYPAKAAVGEAIPIRATVFREGHDAVNAHVVLTDPSGAERVEPMAPSTPLGFDWWAAEVTLETEGAWTFRVEGWDDPWATWVHNAEIKIPAGIDVALVGTEGKALLEAGARAATEADDDEAATQLQDARAALDSDQQVEDRLEVVLAEDVRAAMATHGPRLLLSPSPEYPVFVDRRTAVFGSWYEFFPRSQGASYDPETQTWVSGTFDSSYERVEAAAAMGFDVIYLPPIHPIGTAFRKGPNNTLTPGPADPGSPWAIGNVEGGHDAIHPDLGDFDSFDRFVAKVKSHGMEVALDFALQASPDHPWVSDHPEWFSARPDGSIAYAENPPKKYQDIFPINFDRDKEGIYAESLRLLKLWMSHGVRIFRVDNPHTKPVDFWAWLLAEVRRTDPDVLFLAEAFTKPAMMHALGKAGFQQGYTYFTWRNEKWELEEYLTELTGESDSFFRPNFFVNTPDILPMYLQTGGRTAFTIRAVLAATLAPTWGVYSGFELFENAPLGQGREEYLDSEKFQYRPRDWSGAEASGQNLNLLLGTLNAIRREHPALQQLRNLHFHHAPNADVVVFSKRAGDDVVLVVVSVDPLNTHESEIVLDMAALGLGTADVFLVHDELTGQTFRWGQRAFVRLTVDDPAHILTLVRPGRRSSGQPSAAPAPEEQ